jgi:hypothetical protein
MIEAVNKQRLLKSAVLWFGVIGYDAVDGKVENWVGRTVDSVVNSLDDCEKSVGDVLVGVVNVWGVEK